MHLTEALMAAFEATGERSYLDKAERIADLILRRNAAAADWRVPEHYRADWSVDADYRGSDVFRPYGYTPATRWNGRGSRCNSGRSAAASSAWLPDAARRLFAQAVAQGWDSARGGLYYTTEYDGAPRVRDRLWWPICEGVGAAHFLGALDGDDVLRRLVSPLLGFHRAPPDRPPRRRLAPQLDDSLKPIAGYFVGKPDLYHALQACLIPLYPATGSLTKGILANADKRVALRWPGRARRLF